MSLAYDLDLDADPGPYLDCDPIPSRRSLSLVPALAPAPAPAPRRAGRPGGREAAPLPASTLAVLRPLHDPAPMRLTRRGVVVLGLALAVVGLAVVVLGALSARSATPSPTIAGPAVVTVQAGDTLWSIATDAAPGRDPRAEIATIDRLNSLHGEALVPGQRLRVR